MKVFLTLLLMYPLLAIAQENDAADKPSSAPCSSDEYRQFDFWIGDWSVTANGLPAGNNSIHPIQGSCALQENWQGAGEGGISGTSFNIYDQASGKWHQTWIDSNGTLLQLDGGLANGVMILEGRRPARDQGEVVLHRISWTPSSDGTVRQLWEASNDEGGNWKVLFDGLYTRLDTD